MQTLWDYRYAQRTQKMRSSTIRELLKFTEYPDVISFAGGMPAPEVFPLEAFKEACIKVLTENGPASLQYGSTDGYLPLREMIAQHATRYGMNVSAENILITSGSQQALDLIGMIFINPGDRILVESPTYVGALQAWSAYQAEFISVPIDENGMIPEELETRLKAGPKFIYALPNFQNPTGVTMSYERRLKLIEIADRFGVPIVEDDPYGQLRYEGEHLPPLSVLDNQIQASPNRYTSNVIYLSTFSKTLAPGIRLAWVIASQEVINKLNLAKQGADLHTSTFNQMVAYEVANGGFLNDHVKFIRKVYKERRDAMIDSLSEHMPQGVVWTKPQGGLFLWVTAPECVDCQDLFEDAAKEKVAFVPGSSFYAEGGGNNSMRLNFSNENPNNINEGILRLSKLIKANIQ